MPTDWADIESWKRLAAATWAASPQNHNYRQIATYFGQDSTYDSIEGRFRIIKKEAKKLQGEIDSGQRPEAPVRGGASANSTPRKKKPSAGSAANGAAAETSSPTKPSQSVLSGRVTKANSGTPTKSRGTPRKKPASQQSQQTQGSPTSSQSQSTPIKAEARQNTFGAYPATATGGLSHRNKKLSQNRNAIMYADEQDDGAVFIDDHDADDGSFVVSQGFGTANGHENGNGNGYGWAGDFDDVV
ncbi:MAG: hypothetical protein M4579_000083 [Chaenotheca gracillima]|nr:MAG: hypothetical protein M4579_000083 [Chaenotheca gracillima]